MPGQNKPTPSKVQFKTESKCCLAGHTKKMGHTTDQSGVCWWHATSGCSHETMLESGMWPLRASLWGSGCIANTQYIPPVPATLPGISARCHVFVLTWHHTWPQSVACPETPQSGSAISCTGLWLPWQQLHLNVCAAGTLHVLHTKCTTHTSQCSILLYACAKVMVSTSWTSTSTAVHWVPNIHSYDDMHWYSSLKLSESACKHTVLWGLWGASFYEAQPPPFKTDKALNKTH